MRALVRWLSDFRADERGATAIEYALIGSLISIVIVGALIAINGNMTSIYQRIEGAIVPAIEGAAGDNR
jgi:pilus assembly protein Flp/PilA